MLAPAAGGRPRAEAPQGTGRFAADRSAIYGKVEPLDAARLERVRRAYLEAGFAAGG